MSHRLLTAAAALLPGASAPAIAASTAAPASPAAPLVTPPAAAAPAATAAAPVPAAGTETPVDVVTVADAQAAVATAETRGADAERARTHAVFASAAGKANPTMAAFMLNANPTATAQALIDHIAAAPAPAASTAAPAPAASTAAAPAPAITTALTETPLVVVERAPNAAEASGTSQTDIDKLWDTGMAGASTAASNSFGPDLAPGIPRTGN